MRRRVLMDLLTAVAIVVGLALVLAAAKGMEALVGAL